MAKIEKKDKGLVFAKSSAIALGIVFLVLLALLVILQVNKGKDDNKNRYLRADIPCDNDQIIILKNEVDEVIDSRSELILLTKSKLKNQEIIVLDKKCGTLKRKIKLHIK